MCLLENTLWKLGFRFRPLGEAIRRGTLQGIAVQAGWIEVHHTWHKKTKPKPKPKNPAHAFYRVRQIEESANNLWYIFDLCNCITSFAAEANKAVLISGGN